MRPPLGFSQTVVLADLDAANTTKPAKYKPVRFHLIGDDRFLAEFGFVSKSSTSWALIDKLFERGRVVAGRWLASHHDQLGRASSCDVRAELVKPVLGAKGVVQASAGTT